VCQTGWHVMLKDVNDCNKRVCKCRRHFFRICGVFAVFSNYFYEYQAFYPKTRKRPHVGMSNNLIYKQNIMYFQKILVYKSPSMGPLRAHGLTI
jgi:hypothetical protein